MMKKIKMFVVGIKERRQARRVAKKFNNIMDAMQDVKQIEKFERKDRRRMETHPQEYNWN